MPRPYGYLQPLSYMGQIMDDGSDDDDTTDDGGGGSYISNTPVDGSQGDDGYIDTGATQSEGLADVWNESTDTDTDDGGGGTTPSGGGSSITPSGGGGVSPSSGGSSLSSALSGTTAGVSNTTLLVAAGAVLLGFYLFKKRGPRGRRGPRG
jgi:hypothetical protein